MIWGLRVLGFCTGLKVRLCDGSVVGSAVVDFERRLSPEHTNEKLYMAHEFVVTSFSLVLKKEPFHQKKKFSK